ncbi:MAG: filamentous hemagglutinin N-terminal domain-containing protein, partial [Alphaproteobacteria bacterium]|nr:filamentous hemagglutinin N-terminal domain-containing protein [Alphaproteobacteria bacterium]
MALWRQAVLDVAVLGMFMALAAPDAAAQRITIDGRFSPAQTLAGPNYAITANLGKQAGGNLFHSFGSFGLATGESATFSGPATVSNVIGRVTGGSPSAIDGKIQSTIAGANLFLINPSGIVFGPNAAVNVSGSFHASTADYLKMSDGARFQATNPDGSTLSAAPPAAFGFLAAQPAAITVNGSTLGPVPGTLGLVGGPVSVAGGTLSAPDGAIHVASAAGTGEVPVDPRNTAALTVASFGPVNITGGSTLDVSDATGLGSGGSVFIHSGALTIDASQINADNYGSGPGGQLILRGDSQVALTNDANVHSVAMGSGSGAGVMISSAPSGAISADASTVLTGSTASGNGGMLSIAAGQLSLTNGAALRSDVQAAGSGGPITISADSVVIDGGATMNPSTGIFTTTSDIGRGGSIVIAAGQLSLHNGANVLAASCG